ncbi:hypothetical protein [Blautia faecis]
MIFQTGSRSHQGTENQSPRRITRILL